MADLIVGGGLVILVGAAIAYMIREKKRGVVCIGCPAAGTCGAKNHPGSAGCSCSAGLEASLDEMREAVHSDQVGSVCSDQVGNDQVNNDQVRSGQTEE